MAKLLIKKPIDTLTLEEANAYLGDNAKKRIDHARGALQKMVDAGEARISTAKPRKAKEPKPEVTYEWDESHYEGRQVYTGSGTGEILQEGKGSDSKDYFEVQLRSGRVKAVLAKTVRFKAVKDEYRDGYVKEEEIRTASGAPSLHSGDSLAEALLGTGVVELGGIAKENGLTANYEGWLEKELNAGMIRMNLSNMLRGKIRRHEPITIYGEEDLERAAEKARTRYAKEAARAAKAKKDASK